MQIQDETKPYDDINITPMLDLSYVLLIIFIIMCTAGVQGMKIKLPKPSLTPPTTPTQTKTISILDNGQIMLDRTPQASLTTLEQSLRQIKQQSFTETPFVVRGDSKVPYQTVVSVLDILDRLGIRQVGIATKSSR